MRIGLDIHGVIDTNPEFFGKMTRAFLMYPSKIEIHIMTGSRIGDGKIEEWLREKGIYHTHLFSISDHLSDAGCPELPKSTPDNPWFDDEYWNVAKADYARKHKLDLVLDDNSDYFEHFTTPIARYYSKGDINERK